MKKLIWTLAVLLVMTLSAVAGASAGHRAESVMVSPFVGYFGFDSDLNLDDEFTYGVGLGYNFTEHLAAEAVFNYTDADVEGSPISADGYLYRMDALYHFIVPDKRLVPYVAAGVGAFEFDAGSSGDQTEFSGNFGGGIKFFINERTALRADLRNVMTFPEDSLLYTAGFTFYFGGEEKLAKAPSAEDTPAAAAEKLPDSDGDGVYDSEDRCPNTPGAAIVDSRGCPVDGDEDGVADYRDECPGTVQGAEVDTRGCALDADNDGVINYYDECAQTPQNAEVDVRGCPLDTDGDGVADYADECLNTPAGASVNDRGCWVIGDLQFEVGKAEIRPVYYDSLNEVVSILKQNPDMYVEIQGHTDSRGTAEMNQKLSKKRAAAVLDYLVEKGIDADRLSHKGYGESDPVASNDTARGRAQNRRVEIKPLF